MFIELWNSIFYEWNMFPIYLFYNRSQNETLKKEILDQERGLKCQIATLEKKAHENWVSYSIVPYLWYTVLYFTNLIFRNKLQVK